MRVFAREPGLEVEAAAALTAEFESDWQGDDGSGPRFVIAAMDSAILNDAAALVSSHGLRAYDAVQLSTARRIREILDECNRLATFDEGMRRAAATEGFQVVPSSVG